MPSSQAAASERRNDKTIAHEPPKLKTTLKTPPKQATNPLQFVKVGPCSLYRTAQEQLQKVQEVKKTKPEVRDDPEDWQSNLDNWKSSRRKRQEHIIERVVEVKKLELEEHDRQRRRSKTFSEMMEERGNRGRKLSMSLAMYHEEDINDLSDLGIGTSSGKSSVSGDTHDDMQSVMSDRDSEIEKNHSDVENLTSENNNNPPDINDEIPPQLPKQPPPPPSSSAMPISSTIIIDDTSNSIISSSIDEISATIYDNKFHNDNDTREYDSGNTATASSPEPDELNYEAAITGYVSNVAKNLSTRCRINVDAMHEKSQSPINNDEILFTSNEDKNSNVSSIVKVDVFKRREMFERASQSKSVIRANNVNNNNNSNNNGNSIMTKQRLSSLERQNNELEYNEKIGKAERLLVDDMSSIRERLNNLEKEETAFRGNINPDVFEECSITLTGRGISSLEKYANEELPTTKEYNEIHFNDNKMSAISQNFEDLMRIKDNEAANDNEKSPKTRSDEETRMENRSMAIMAAATVAPPAVSERSSSPDSKYRPPRAAAATAAAFHRSLDSLDPNSCSGLDTFERVHSLEELDYTTSRYPGSSSSAELLHDTDREDSGIHTADVSCSVSQADEDVLHHPETIFERQEEILDNRSIDEPILVKIHPITDSPQREKAAMTIEDTADTSSSSTCPYSPSATLGILSNKKNNTTINHETSSSSKFNNIASDRGTWLRPIVYQSPTVPPRRTPPDMAKSKSLDSSKIESYELEHDDNANCTILPIDNCPKVESTMEKIEIFSIRDDTEDSPCDGATGSSSNKTSSNPQEAKRTISKIPTPLPRKSLNVRNLPGSSSIVSQTKFTNKPSKIPYSTTIPNATGKINNEDSTFFEKHQAAERRRTIVDVFDKIVISHDDIPVNLSVTPFVTVSKIDNQRNNEEAAIVDDTKEETETEENSSLSIIDGSEEFCRSNEPMTNLAKLHEQQITEIEGVPEVACAVSSPSSCKLSLNESEIMEKDSRRESLQDPVELFEILSSNEMPQLLNLTSEEELVNGPMTFALGPPTSVEPPKEKPPPPPIDLSDEENIPAERFKRLNSTRRIKKELRTRRSDFLGIEGINDDYLERELNFTRPPDMAAILAEERRIEQLNRRSYDTDSNYERDSSHERDSGVELSHAEDTWSKQPVSPDMSEHSRQSSEPFGASVTSSEEDEITKKEREIMEVLEKEEQWRYGNDRELNSDIGEKLAHKLRQLEEEKMQLERERVQETQQRRCQEENSHSREQEALREQQQKLQQQQEREIAEQEEAKRVIEEKKIRDDELLAIKTEELRMKEAIEVENLKRSTEARRQQDMRIKSIEMMNRMSIREQIAASNGHDEDDFSSGEVMRVERELLQLEQEELKRRRTNVAYRQQRQIQMAEQLHEQWQSLQDVARGATNNGNIRSHYKCQAAPIIDYRSSMPNLQLQQESNRRRAPPPPPPAIPTSKPTTKLVEQIQRDVSIRNSRVPSADSIPQQVDGGLCGSLATLGGQQQMTKQTLHALSAVPRSRIVKGDQWVQRRKSDIPRGTQEYNYQHWLIQEAEQRRITEKNERSIVRKGGQQHVTGTSVPYTAITTSSRSDGKPLPDSIIQTLTQRVQNRAQERPAPPPPPHRRRLEQSASNEHLSSAQHQSPQHVAMLHNQKIHQFSTTNNGDSQEKMLSVSGKKKCSHCGDELGRGAAMIIESLRLFYHMECFKCCVCHVRLGDGLMGTDVRVRNHKLHCHNCYSSDDGVKFSCV